MVRIRSMTTSAGHQESGNASSHPNRAQQSAPTMQSLSIQQMQSMAAALGVIISRGANQNLWTNNPFYHFGINYNMFSLNFFFTIFINKENNFFCY